MDTKITKKQVRVRIAPSPTGYPHIGTVYQALFNFAYAKKHNGKFLVRIEDTDRNRFVDDAEKAIFDALDWFGLIEDESPRKGGPFEPYRQSERLPLYQKHTQDLVKKGHAYYCFCTKERLDDLRNKLQAQKKPIMYDQHCRNLPADTVAKKLEEKIPFVIRMKIPDNEKIVVNDEIRGDIIFDSHLIDDQIILKSDGFPTYHLAFIVDDHEMGITHVIRAEEWLSSTPKHVLLYRYLGWKMPPFYHTPALRNPDKSKMSKRHSHTNVAWYQEHGFLPQAILNFLALMGWSAPEGEELFSLDEFIQMFDVKDIKAVGPIFDLRKLEWMNGEYIRQLSITDLRVKLKVHYPQLKEINNAFLDKIIELAQTRMNTLNDFWPQVQHFFEEPHLSATDEKDVAIAEDLIEKFDLLDEWNTEKIFPILKDTMQLYGVKMPVLYRLLTGAERGLPLPQSLELLGKEKTKERLEKIIA